MRSMAAAKKKAGGRAAPPRRPRNTKKEESLSARAKRAMGRLREERVQSKIAVAAGGAGGWATAPAIARLHEWSDEKDKRIHIPRTKIGYVEAAGIVVAAASLLATKKPYGLGIASYGLNCASADRALSAFRKDSIAA